MSEHEYALGQRWVSNTESELGLGIIAGIENRRVVVSFPAVGERRTYAIDNAPLSRVRYNVGEEIANDAGETIVITERHEIEGCVVYLGENAEREIITIDEINLDSFVQFSLPLERMFAGQLDKTNAFSLRLDAINFQHRHASAPAFGLLGPRAQLLAHQFYIAAEVSRRYQPRVLLADEVGLGKTIEAGLILHQQLLSGRVRRALIVVPETLIHQWLIEMLRRFNLQFSIVGPDAFEREQSDEEILQDEPENPFEAAQLVLCSLSTLVESDEHFAAVQAAPWDLLIVDEAHHLAWQAHAPSDEYQRIEQLARKVPGLLLITATPEQLGIEGHFARLRLLDPDRFPDLEQFLAGEKRYLDVGQIAERLIQPDAAEILKRDPELLNALRPFLSEERFEDLSPVNGAEVEPSAIEAALSHLLDQHGTGRVLFRNRRESVKGFPGRSLSIYPLPLPSEYANQDLSVDVIGGLTPEQHYEQTWIGFDPRVSWLLGWISKLGKEKVLLITARRETAEALENYLRVRHGLRSAVFHEGLDLIARDRAAAYFAEEDEGADLLICSEIGSEGRNFQFAHHLVLFDLPFNPDLLEQRIGRLDRIGQKHNVQIHVPYFEQSPTSVLFMWYHAGLNAFEQVCSIGLPLLERHESELKQHMLAGDETDAFDSFIMRVQQEAEKTRQQLREGRDRLLEMNSCRPDVAANVVANVRDSTQALELADFMERLFDFFGVDQQASSSSSIVIHPGDQMLCESFPGLPEGGVTATFDRVQALAREDMHFLTWEHPMVTGAMDMLLSGEFGNATICTLKAPFLKPGILFLEAIFVFQCAGPRVLQLDRYLAESSRRVVVDISGKDLTEILTTERLAGIAQTVPKRTAQEIAKHARKQIEAMAARAESLLSGALEDAISNAIAQAQAINGEELARLKSLAAINQNIRQSEIDFLDALGTQITGYLAGTKLRLDSVRVALSS